MQGAEKAIHQEVGIEAGGDADIVSREGCLERVDDTILAATREVVPEAGDDRDAEALLGCLIKRLMEEGVVDLDPTLPDGGDECDQLLPQSGEDLPDLGGLHARLVLIQQGIVQL